MKFGVVNKSTIVNKFILHTVQRNITHLAVITRKTNKKTRYFERRGNWKRASVCTLQRNCKSVASFSFCSDFRYESNGIFVLGVGFFF